MGIINASTLSEKWGSGRAPTDPRKTYEGATILVTGANSGLGLETAKQLANAGATELIITTRSASKGETTVAKIRKSLNDASQSVRITPLVLEMNSLAGVDTFIESLEHITDKLHVCVINAGVSTAYYRTTKGGLEETVQVNAVSTIYLGQKLLPLLLKTSKTENQQTRLLFVSSRLAVLPPALPEPEIQAADNVLQSLSAPESFPPGPLGGHTLYSRSKLVLEYAMRHLAQSPQLRDADGKPLVIVSSVCPGVVTTQISREVEQTWLFPVLKLMRLLISRDVSVGATIYLQALAQDDKIMGQMWSPTGMQPEWDHLTSQQGRAYGEEIWKEIRDLTLEWNPKVWELLESV